MIVLMFIFLFINNFVFSHLVLNHPAVWGLYDGGDLETPLTTETQNYICAGKTPTTNKIINFVAGKTYKFQTICGELDFNAPGCLNGDWHSNDEFTDYAGCVLSVAYKNYKEPKNHKLISYSKNCAKKYQLNLFRISKNVMNTKKAVCSWSWTPSTKYSR